MGRIRNKAISMSLSPSGIFIKLNGQHKTKVGRLCRFASMEKNASLLFH